MQVNFEFENDGKTIQGVFDSVRLESLPEVVAHFGGKTDLVEYTPKASKSGNARISNKTVAGFVTNAINADRKAKARNEAIALAKLSDPDVLEKKIAETLAALEALKARRAQDS